jgi:FkbM family methyltransferase
MVDVFVKRAAHGGVLLDIGAHMGYYSSVWIKLGGTSSEALEPVPENREVIIKVIARNRLQDKIHLLPFAASDAEGTAELVLPGESLGHRSMARLRQSAGGAGSNVPSASQDQSCLEVQTRRVDDLVEGGQIQPPDLVKIDVEGAEASVIRGAKRTLSRYKPWVICEIHGMEQALSLAQILHDLDYRLTTLGETKASMALCLATCDAR